MAEMINYYKKIPKKFLNNVPNPQYKQHLIKTPMRLICSAPSGSGKSTFVLNLLQRFSSGEGTFQKIFIITKDSEPLYDYLQTKSDNIFVDNSLRFTKKLCCIRLLKSPQQSREGFVVSKTLEEPIISRNNCINVPLPAPCPDIIVGDIDFSAGYWSMCAIHLHI